MNFTLINVYLDSSNLHIFLRTFDSHLHIFLRTFHHLMHIFLTTFVDLLHIFRGTLKEEKRVFKEGPQTFLFLIRYRSMAKSTTMNAMITPSAQNGNAYASLTPMRADPLMHMLASVSGNTYSTY